MTETAATTATTASFTTLISAEELARHAGKPGWLILDCRHDLADPGAGAAAYAGGHLPEARFASIDTDLSDKSLSEDGVFRGRHPLPSRAAFLDTLRRWGMRESTQIVAYDAHGGMFAARLWWMLRWIGHDAVAVLDGGLPAWTAAGQPLSTVEPKATSDGDIADRPSLVTTVDTADILGHLGSNRRVIVDARAPDRFRGENETLDPVAGHIPGARNRFFKNNLEPDGRFRPAADLRADFAALADEPSAVVMQCGSGVTACHNLLAMEVAGLPGAALYPGSWSEWCADPARPVARDGGVASA